MTVVSFSLFLDSKQYLAYYKGQARRISVVCDDGRRIEFPAEHLRPYLTHDGIRGHFEIEFDQHQRFVALRQT